MVRSLTPRQLICDLVIAVISLPLFVVGGVDSLSFFAASLFLAAALAVRRLSPAVALGLAWVGGPLGVYSGAQSIMVDIAIFAVLYASARYGEAVLRWLGLASAVLGAIIAVFYTFFLLPEWVNSAEATQMSPFFSVFLLVLTSFILMVLNVLSWGLGFLVKMWTTARDSRRAQLAAERTVVVEQERNRIARDMHDVVAH
ncbi:MAG: DUF7134 domain-containing protein, partial [Rhodoglobus sp.]